MSKQFPENLILKLGPNSEKQILYFFGTRHTNDYRDEQFNYIKQFWSEFLNKSERQKSVFVEGAIHEIPQDYEEAIRWYGETGAIQWLGREAGIKVIRPEPTEAGQRKYLCAKFDSKLVAYAVIAQNLASWFSHIGKTTFDEAVNQVLKREAGYSEVYGFVPNKEWLVSQHKELFGEQMFEDKSFLVSITDPTKNDTAINKIVSARSKMRNENILAEIKKAWESGKSIFIVYGKGHLAALESYLRDLIP